MLVSVASLLPIVVVGPIADVIGPSPVFFATAVVVGLWGIGSVIKRGPLSAAEVGARAGSSSSGAPVDPMTAATLPTDLAAVEARAEQAEDEAMSRGEVGPRSRRGSRP